MKSLNCLIKFANIISPMGIGLEAFENNLINEIYPEKTQLEFVKSDYSSKLAYLVKDFNPKNYINPNVLRKMDPFSILSLYCGKQLLEFSQFEDYKNFPKETGIFVGTGFGSTSYTDLFIQGLVKKRPKVCKSNVISQYSA